jgi:hypothetical protein
MISKTVYVHWLNNHAFTGAVNARQVRVTKVAHRHIKMTGKAWKGSNSNSCACLYCSTYHAILTHIPAAVGGQRWHSTGVN